MSMVPETIGEWTNLQTPDGLRKAHLVYRRSYPGGPVTFEATIYLDGSGHYAKGTSDSSMAAACSNAILAMAHWGEMGDAHPGRFHVRRTSTYLADGNHDAPPCPEAYRAVYTRDDDMGREPTEGWFVDLPTYDDLMMFIRREGRVVISNRAWDDEDAPEIEIYDELREG